MKIKLFCVIVLNIFLEIDLGDLNLASLREAIKMTNPSRNDSKEKGRDE